jgi:hypothetical protein
MIQRPWRMAFAVGVLIVLAIGVPRIVRFYRLNWLAEELTGFHESFTDRTSQLPPYAFGKILTVYSDYAEAKLHSLGGFLDVHPVFFSLEADVRPSDRDAVDCIVVMDPPGWGESCAVHWLVDRRNGWAVKYERSFESHSEAVDHLLALAAARPSVLANVNTYGRQIEDAGEGPISTTGSTGKVVVLEKLGGRYRLHGLHFELPAERRAMGDQDAAFLVLRQSDRKFLETANYSEFVGLEGSPVDRYSEVVTFTVVDRATGRRWPSISIEGEPPPHTKQGGGHEHEGASPDDALCVAKLLEALDPAVYQIELTAGSVERLGNRRYRASVQYRFTAGQPDAARQYGLYVHLVETPFYEDSSFAGESLSGQGELNFDFLLPEIGDSRTIDSPSEFRIAMRVEESRAGPHGIAGRSNELTGRITP